MYTFHQFTGTHNVYIKSVRIMLAIAAFYDYEIWQMDVKTAFLNGFLKEELYMMQPEGFVDPKGANKVCKLQRSIYGLVQASRSCNKRFDSVIKAFGVVHTFGEACIYKKVSGSSVAFLILYVDDILLIGNDIEFLDSIKGYLNKSFSMKDLGEAAYICWKYALEVIIKGLLLYFLVHDNCLHSCYNCIIRKS